MQHYNLHKMCLCISYTEYTVHTYQKQLKPSPEPPAISFS